VKTFKTYPTKQIYNYVNEQSQNGTIYESQISVESYF